MHDLPSTRANLHLHAFCLYFISVHFSFSFYLFNFCLFTHFSLPLVPEAPPQAVSGRFVDAHRLKVSWKPPRRDKQNGAIQGYQISYVENDSSDNTLAHAKNETVKGDAREHEINNLQTWTKYMIWVLAFTRVGIGPASQPITVQTDEDGR